MTGGADKEVERRPRARAVPSELVGREVSVRMVTPLWQALQAKGLDPQLLARGTGCTPAQLTDPRERMSWASFVQLLANAGSVMRDDELIELGASALSAPLLRALLLPGRLLFGVADFYVWVFSPRGPASQMFVTWEGTVEVVAPGRLRFESRMKPGYAPSRENYLLLRGSLRELSRTLGAAEATVRFTPTVDGATFDIDVPHATGALHLARRGWSWMFAARANAESLRQAHTELHDRYVQLQRETAARTEAERELRRLNIELEHRVAARTAELETSNRELEAFNYTLTHDLGAPLRAMERFAEALHEEHDTQLDDRGRDYIRRIRSAAARMRSLIEGLVQLSHAARAELRTTRVDLAAIAHHIVGELARGEPERRVETVIADQLVARVDPQSIEVALRVLIGNAWRFTRARAAPRIEVGAVRDDGRISYFVRDNGVGLDGDGGVDSGEGEGDGSSGGRARRVTPFEPVRVLRSAEQFAASGVGLAIVQRIIARHGGTIWAESVRGAGATFFFTVGERA